MGVRGMPRKFILSLFALLIVAPALAQFQVVTVPPPAPVVAEPVVVAPAPVTPQIQSDSDGRP